MKVPFSRGTAGAGGLSRYPSPAPATGSTRKPRAVALLVTAGLVLSACPTPVISNPPSPSISVTTTPQPTNRDARSSFLWGAATSSYQVEGGIDCSDPKAPCNDYDFFNSNDEIRKRVGENSSKIGPAITLRAAGIAADTWNPDVFRRDLDNAKLLGLNALRISLEWARIEPTQPVDLNGTLTHKWDNEAIEHYVLMLDEMRARGIQPIVVLNHFTLPLWVLHPPVTHRCIPVAAFTACFAEESDPKYQSSLRGWDNSMTVARYVDYVKAVVPRLKDRVDYWLTINEPVGSMIAVGYIAGVWSPGFLLQGDIAKSVLPNLIKAHVDAYDAIKELDDSDADGDTTASMVGFAHAMGETVASPPSTVLDGNIHELAASNFAYFMNDYFLNAVTRGQEDVGYLKAVGPLPSDQRSELVQHDEWKGRLDFLGINYYRRFHVYRDTPLSIYRSGFLGGNHHSNLWGKPERHEILSDLGWAIYPQGLYNLIMRAKNEWNLPVMVTENGVAEHTDRNRAPFIVGQVSEVARAVADGANVIGYLHWSLIDNWELAENYRPDAQFGLFHIDRTETDTNGKPALHRAITEGALAYKHVIDESRAYNARGVPTIDSVESAASKFGAISADGRRVRPPTRTHGRFWEGTSPQGPITLYLTDVGANRSFKGLLLRREVREWRAVELRVDTLGPYLHETWFDRAGAVPAARDLRVSYANGTFTFADGGTASRVPAAGLWRWSDGHSPWGGDFFYVSKFEGSYAGKYVSFSDPDPIDVPASGPMWQAFHEVSLDGQLRLDGRGRAGEDLFDLTLSMPSADTAETIAARKGTFSISKRSSDRPELFDYTGYVAPSGDFTWIGRRDGSTVSQLKFLEKRGVFLERPTRPEPIPGAPDQYFKENDGRNVLPLDNFSFRPTTLLGTRANFSWEAGGRAYNITGALTQVTLQFCGPLPPCAGTWSDIPGRVAQRQSEQFAPVADAVVEPVARTTGVKAGRILRLDAGRSFDFDGNPMTFRWSGSFGSLVGAQQTVFLPFGRSEVCLAVTNQYATSTDCVTVALMETVHGMN